MNKIWQNIFNVVKTQLMNEFVYFKNIIGILNISEKQLPS